MEGKATLKRQFFYGDCKVVLEEGEIPPESVNLIYLNPPFNKLGNSEKEFGNDYQWSVGPERIS